MKIAVFNIGTIISGDIVAPRAAGDTIVMDDGKIVSVGTGGDAAGCGYNADHRWFLAKGWARTDAFKWLYGGLSHPVDFIRWYLPAIEEVMGYSRLSKTAGRVAGA